MKTKQEYQEALNRMEESYYDSDNSMGEMKRFKEDVNLLCGLVNEHFDEKVETNFEHYKDRILDCCIDHLAVVKGIPKPCSKIDCNYCDFLTIQKECCELAKGWLNHPYRKTPYKLNKFEFDLIQTYRDCNTDCKLSERRTLRELKNKGYFKNVDKNELIKDIIENCEVIKND